MIRQSIVAGIALLLLAATGLAQAHPPPLDATIAEVQSAARVIVTSFHADASAALGHALAVAPEVAIANTPGLATYDSRSNEIVLAHWPTLDGAARGFFLSLADTEEAAGRLFVGLFDWFLIAHEMTHWLQRAIGLQLDRYGSEAMANDVAVAFFARSPEGEESLVALAGLVETARARLDDPTPDGVAPAVYFNATYGPLTQDPARYGYYQFGFILDAIARRAEFSFVEIVSSLRPQ